MNKFNNAYTRILINSLYDVSSKLINEEINSYISFIQEKYPDRKISYELPIFCEDVYFQQWDVNKSCINAIKNILNQILENFKKSKDIDDLEIKYPIKKFLNDIDYTLLSNYKNFHKFLDLLKLNSKGFLVISIGKSNDSFYEPPIKFGYPPKNGLIADSYYEYIEDLTKDEEIWHDKIQKIMNELFSLENFGTINISSIYFNKKTNLLETVLAHEISHFIKFLIRVNSLNYKYGLYCSKLKCNENYFLKADEWKELAATYIEELAIMFDKNIQLKNYIIFINELFRYCKIPYEKCFSDDEYDEFIEIFTNESFHYQNIKEFIQTTYKSSTEGKLIRNNWKIFRKWLFNEFKKRFSKI